MSKSKVIKFSQPIPKTTLASECIQKQCIEIGQALRHLLSSSVEVSRQFKEYLKHSSDSARFDSVLHSRSSYIFSFFVQTACEFVSLDR